MRENKNWIKIYYDYWNVLHKDYINVSRFLFRWMCRTYQIKREIESASGANITVFLVRYSPLNQSGTHPHFFDVGKRPANKIRTVHLSPDSVYLSAKRTWCKLPVSHQIIEEATQKEIWNNYNRSCCSYFILADKSWNQWGVFKAEG